MICTPQRWFGRLLLEGYVLYDIDGNGRKLDSNGKRTIGEKGMPSCILCKQKLRDGNSAVALTQMQPTPQVPLFLLVVVLVVLMGIARRDRSALAILTMVTPLIILY